MSGTLASFLFNCILPDDCRLCETPLQGISRIPVCSSCLALPKPLQLEYFCRTCRTPFVDALALDGTGLCTVCRESLENFDSAYCYGSYEGSLQKLITLFKYGKVESLAAPLSRLLLQSLPFGENFNVVMGMPMHWKKQWQRGFNQAELLAEPVARRFGLPLSRNLRRARYTAAQAGLGEIQRQKNLKNSFVVRHPETIFGKRVLLVDDVFTTGATLRTAAAALKASGVKQVTALTLARVDHRALYSGGERQRLRPSGRSKGFESDLVPFVVDEHKTQTAVLGAR